MCSAYQWCQNKRFQGKTEIVTTFSMLQGFKRKHSVQHGENSKKMDLFDEN